MFLSRLHLRDFRNFSEQRLEFPPEGVAIIGDNGQGKTNLLEAIYYLEICRSFRGSPDEQLVRFGEEVFRVEGELREEGGEPRVIAAAFDRKAKRKKVTIDGNEPARLSDGVGGLGAAIFSPTDVALVAGSPAGRRRYLDIVLSLAVPGYLHALLRYRQTLGQRNALLRQGAAPALVAAWNGGLVTWGSRLMDLRAAWVREYAERFGQSYAAISGGPRARLSYEPSFPVDEIGEEEISGALSGELERTAEREQRRGMTLAGPHRDDLQLEAEAAGPDRWVDLRAFGSGGQQRTAAVALRMIEAATIRETRGREPIILLDDVFAELDPGRSSRIRDLIEQQERGQVILTAPKSTDVEVRGGSLVRWGIRDGRIANL